MSGPTLNDLADKLSTAYQRPRWVRDWDRGYDYDEDDYDEEDD